MPAKDYYTVLGVKEEAGEQEIKRAYRTLAKRYHPDRNRGDRSAEARFKEIQEAYDVLSDPEKRRKYDHLRKAGPGGFEGIDLEDLFGGLSGGGFGGSLFDLFERAGMGRGGPRRSRRGEDQSAEVTVPFETAAFGGTVTIAVPRAEPCASCSGSGAAAGSGAETCRACGGTGTSAREGGGFAFSRPCPRCYGRGRVVARPCAACGGAGSRTATHRLEVRVPAGVDDGARIRLRGQGDPGGPGGEAGDLLLTVRVRDHEVFRRDGLDVESDLLVDIPDAALGTTREVRTLTGPVEVRVPAGVQPGARLRLRGRGVRDHRGRCGDHYVRVQVRIPRRLGDRERALFEELRRLPREEDRS